MSKRPTTVDGLRGFSADLVALRRQVLVLGLLIGVPSIVVVYMVRAPDDPIMRIAAPPGLLYLLFFTWVLVRRPQHAQLVSRVTLTGAQALWVVMMGVRLGTAPDVTDGWHALFPTTFMGLVVFLVVGYLLHPTRAAVWRGGVVTAAVGVTGLAVLLAREGGQEHVLDLLRYCIYLVVLGVLLHVLSRAKERAAQAFLATEHAKQEAHGYRDLAYSDALTGLANRRRLVEELAHQAERLDPSGHGARRDGSGTGEVGAQGTDGGPPRRPQPGPVAVIFLDLDRFKEVNDEHGHAVGDDVLRTAAALLEGLVRKQDLVARLGGEEFVVVAPGVDADRARELAERLRSALPEATRLSTGVAVTGSFGVAMMRPGEGTLDVLARVDGLMYAAKAAGRNRVVLAPS